MKGQISYDMKQEDQSSNPDDQICDLIDQKVKEIKNSKDEDFEYITAMCKHCGFSGDVAEGTIGLNQALLLNKFYRSIHTHVCLADSMIWMNSLIDDAVFELAKKRAEEEL